MSKSSLATIEVPAYEGNYTKGRNTTIKAITIHHMAGKLTAQRCGELFQRVGRKGSSHYGIGYNGEIANYVDENDTAWTNSNWPSNCESVTIETSNDEVGGNWHVSDKSLESLIKLIADIAIRNNLGTLVKGENLTWHQLVADKKYPTACPGPYLISKLDYIIEKANEIINPPKEEVKFKVGDKVKIIATGNGSSYGTSNKAYGLGWIRYITAIYEGRPFPYQVGNQGKTDSVNTTGFYAESALQKLS